VGLAVTSQAANAIVQATVSQLAVSPTTLSDGSQTADIGAPAIAGSASFSDGRYAMTAGGSDIGGTSDQFRFVYRKVSGDVDIIGRVDALQQTDASSKAGVMVRETLEAGAREVSTLLSARNGYVFEWRADAAATTSTQAEPTGGIPGWVRLIRSG